ncbi:MAG: TonB-dependent receptor, partial [Ignavibacteriaceae bacterium]|nr:TonB-dependent receptor [Ignavibacteriaceae bacterium]
MKILIVLFFIFNFSLFAQQMNLRGKYILQEISFRGKVVDKETNLPLQNANVIASTKKGVGTSTNSEGDFIISSDFSNNDTIFISFIGYQSKIISIGELLNLPSVKNADGNVFFTFYLTKKAIPSQTVLVEATIGKKGITPLAFDQLNAKEIEKNYTVYDIPKYLSDLPSTTFYSESGNGIGYNYISIRGFDQRRISVSINGIPQNDPEDHNVYWLDFPDLLSSTELIQVQRGAGSGVFGYPAIGGSIDIITSNFSNKPKLELSASYGSYVTRKYSTSFS